MRESNTNNKGFSLVEMLVAITILVIVVAPLSQVLISSSKVNQKTKKTMSATEMAQNMFEGMESKGAEDAIIELSSLAAYSSNVTLDKKESIIPGGMSYEDIGEFTISTDPSTGAEVISKSGSAGGTFVKSKVLDSTTGKYRCKGFEEANDDKYMFWIKGLKQQETYYDVTITMDASEYDTSYTPDPSDPNSIDYVTVPTISNVNTAYDGMYVEGTLALNNVVTGEYSAKQIVVGVSDADILRDLKRTYTIDIKDVGAAGSPQIVANISKNYEYKNTTQLASGYDGKYFEGEECIFDSSASGSAPRSLFIYYTPNYNSTSTGDNALDHFVINNTADVDVNVYIIRMQQNLSNAEALGNVTEYDKEQYYAASVYINESVNISNLSTINTEIRTNLDDNITKNTTLAEYKDRSRNSTLITYKINSNTAEASKTALKNAKKLKSLDAQLEKERVYNVTVDVYMGKSVGQKNDNNANSSYAGAFENDFPEGAKLATFTSSIVR